MTLRIGVIPTNGRPCVDQAIESLLHQVQYVVVVVAGNNVVEREYPGDKIVVLRDDGELNISRWWNLGLDWAEKMAVAQEADRWDVAIINDDVEVPPTWLCYVADDMRTLGCAASCSGGTSSAPKVHRSIGAINLYERMQGFAYVLAGEKRLRADERMHWWFEDDDLGLQAIQHGGLVMMPSCSVKHKYPDAQVTGEMQVQIGRDREIFVAKWGFAPW